MTAKKRKDADGRGVVVVVGSGVRGFSRGSEVEVDAETAHRLVSDGHADYPKGK